MKKFCTNVTCGTKNIKVETDAEDCISCGRELKDAAPDLSDLFSNDPAKRKIMKDMFGL